MKKATCYLGMTIVLLLIVAAVGTYLAPHFGWRVDAVISGSMEPELKVGSLVVARPVDPETIVPGDVITFRIVRADENVVTHRVIGIKHSSPLYFETKGDANELPDPFTIPARNLIGKICLHIPYMGYVTEFLKTPFGYILGLVIPTVILIAVYVRAIWLVISNSRKQKASEIQSR